MAYSYEQGNSSNLPIVFLQGGGLSHKSWKPVVEYLTDFFCLMPDLPGHGQSQNIPFSLEGSAAEVADLITQKAPNGKAYLVGLSLGGAVILTLLRLYPGVADHVILTGSSGRLPKWLVQMSLPFFEMLRFMKAEILVRSTLKQQDIPEKYYVDLYEDVLLSSTSKFLTTIYTELTKLEMPEKISCPLLVCVGEKETGAAKLYGQISLIPLQKYPSARGVAMPNGGHVWALQFPDVFAQMVSAWVTDHPLPSILRPLRA
jgi:pimeloyl-ACP methyl ester carboxylesterase